jgi:hypothetical protein
MRKKKNQEKPKMTNPNPNPQDLQVVTPGQQAPAQVPVHGQQQPGPAQHSVEPPDSDARGGTQALEDRILSPEETEALLGGKPLPGESPQSNADDPTQAAQVQQWLTQTPLPPGYQPQVPTDLQPAGQQPAPLQQPQQVPPQLTPEQRAQMTQADLQQQTTQIPPGQLPPGQQPPQQPQMSPTESALQAQLQLMQQQNAMLTERLRQQPTTAQPGQAPQPGQPSQTAQPPAFTFDVPDQYMAALASEDAGTRKLGLNSLLNGVAEAVMAKARQEMTAFGETVPQMIQSQTQGLIQAQDVQRDMYGTYPELEPFRDFVKAAAQQIGGSIGVQGWNADIRDAIAERVAPMVPGLFQKIQASRAARITPQQMLPGQQMQVMPQQQMLPQALPQGYWQNPNGSPTGMMPAVGGTHGAPASPQPVYVRDAAGNLVPMQGRPQAFPGGSYSRPEADQVDPQLADIWHTLGFAR